MNKYWFVINGNARTGKGTFVNYLSKYANVKSISTVDVIKKVCTELGWDGEKDDKGRLALSDFKDLSTKYFDHSYNYVQKSLKEFMNSNYDILTVDSREPEEINRFVKNLGFKTILIKNDNIKHVPNNHADENVYNYNYDYVIYNNGTLDDLNNKVFEFYKNLK